MKIIIIGAGVSGLSLYLFLKKHLLSSIIGQDLSVTIYEAYDIENLTATIKPLSEANSDEPLFTPVAIGNALGISRNGLKVLRRLDSDGNIINDMRRRGNPITHWRMSNARGWELANVSMTPSSTTSKPGSDHSAPGKDEMSIMIARQDLWEVIRNEAVKDRNAVITKKICNIVIGDSTNKSIVKFDDGTSEEADLVVGADGLRSILRRAMFEHPEEYQSVKEDKKSGILTWLGLGTSNKTQCVDDYITPHYEGLAGFGGFIPTKELQRDSNFHPKTMNIVFGPNGFFGYGCITSSPPSTITTDNKSQDSTSSSSPPGAVSAWWSTFSSPTPYPYRREPPSPAFDKTTAVKDLLTRHRTWNNPTIQHILDYASHASLTPSQFYPTWTTPELPAWQKNGTVVLIGDAAHALQPSSGQGANQAFEDAEALALLLKHYLSKATSLGDMGRQEAVAMALKKYEKLRMPRVHLVWERSQRFGKAKSNMGFLKEMFLYLIIWLMTFFHDKYNDVIVGYDLPGEVEKIVAME